MEEKTKKGKLKIFFGYAAGVGKTYAMLEAAHQMYVQNTDVVIGYIEPHNRKETTGLIYGLEQIPTKKIIYKNKSLYEFDIDATLSRHPQLVLVDELAHTNVQGSRHTKRYSDIQELLRAGIDVYTTINVQHLESLHDIIESMTRVKVNERIPDHIFDEADDVKLVDIEIDDLIKRLKDGKIYQEKQVKRALEHFFIKENLTALREIALRRCADRVNIITPKNNQSFVREHILVCLGSSPTNEKVIRTASRMAQAFHANYSALYVETSQSQNLSKKAMQQLQANLTLAKHLGADIVSTYGDDIAFQIAQYSKTSSVSKLVLGRSYQKPSFTKRRTIVDQLSSEAPNLEIYIIPDHRSSAQKRQLEISKFIKFSPKEAIISLIIFTITTILGCIFDSFHFNVTSIILLYVLSSCVIGVLTYYPIYNILVTTMSILSINFLFINPRFTLTMSSSDYPFVFLVMFIVSITISILTHNLKKENILASIHAHSMDVLLEMSQRLQLARSYEDIKHETCYQLHRVLDKLIIFYPVKENQLLKPTLFGETITETIESMYINHEEKAVAMWVLTNNKNAGVSTSTLPGAKGLYLSIRKNDKIFAIIGIAMTAHEELPPHKKTLLHAILNEVALTMDSIFK